ncbi:glycosyltransferase family 31 protein [Rutstroemia sp. NJR-2017a BVV2]|nr:glycosyltransferase family 31 protein [Rutstroemia sp. NJR-2017a BVV2]
MLFKKPSLIVATITLTLVILTRYGSRNVLGQSQTFGDNSREPEEQLKEWLEVVEEAQTYKCNVSETLTWLEKYELSYPLKYASRDIITKPGNGSRPSITVVDKPLFDGLETIELEALQAPREVDRCSKVITLDVPRAPPHKIDASHMVFGLQTTMKRLRETKKHLARWLPNTGARLFAIVIEKEEKMASKSSMAKLQKEFHKEGMAVTIMSPVRKEDYFNQRYFSLIPVMYANRDEKTQWVVIMDDDTFFPSLRALTDELALHDHTLPQYIGGISEDWDAVKRYGFMAFGGAGIFLSLPLAQTVWEHNDECKNNMRFTSGDTLVMDCIYVHSSAQFTPIPGLSQIDLMGDHSGFYENGRRVLSLHHWKAGSATLYPYEMEKMHLIAEVCDDCFLQRYQFSSDVVLTNGFSIAKYPDQSLNRGIDGNLSDSAYEEDRNLIDLRRTEVTWDKKEMQVFHSLAPTRPPLDKEQKQSWTFLDSFLVEDGKVVRQVYVRREIEGEGDHASERDEILVLNWRDGSRLKPVLG